MSEKRAIPVMADLGKRLYRQKYLQLMTLPGLAFLVIFCYFPMYGIIIAFKNYKITRTIAASPWIGFEYFKELFGNGDFFAIIGNTLAISGLKLLVAFPLSILFALLLNEINHPLFKRIIQTISYLPHFLSWVILSGIIIPWLSESGFLNEVLVLSGILEKPIGFLAFPKYFWTITVISEIWKETGWSAIIFIAAISGVDPQIYEAATIDGIGRFRRMWNITLPSISVTITMLFILNIGGLMGSNFDQIFILKNALNAPRAEVIDTFVYETGIRLGRYSYATAAGLFQSFVALALLLTANTISKKIQDEGLF
jgi:putative aldouronate transport system permease protein